MKSRWPDILSFAEVLRALRCAEKAGMVPARVLLPEGKADVRGHVDLSWDSQAVFGVSAGLASELVVLSDGYLSVWEERGG